MERTSEGGMTDEHSLGGPDSGSEAVQPITAAIPVAAPPAVDLTPFKRLIAIDRELERIGENVKALGAERKKLEEVALNALASSGMRNVPLNDEDGCPVIVGRKAEMFVSKAKDVESSAIIERLRALELGSFCYDAYNAMRLKSYVVEELAAGREIDPKLRALLFVGSHESITVLRTTTKPSKTQAAMRKLQASEGSPSET